MKCKECGKEVIPQKIKRGLKKIFCSNLCKTRYDSSIYYYQHKLEPEYKRNRQERVNKWIAENREHFNDICRESNRLRAKARQKAWKDLGLCSHCGGRVEDKRWITCIACRKMLRRWYYRNKDRLK